jgi:hypothetical protein
MEYRIPSYNRTRVFASAIDVADAAVLATV